MNEMNWFRLNESQTQIACICLFALSFRHQMIYKYKNDDLSFLISQIFIRSFVIQVHRIRKSYTFHQMTAMIFNFVRQVNAEMHGTIVYE